jgi:hypothetical protein
MCQLTCFVIQLHGESVRNEYTIIGRVGKPLFYEMYRTTNCQSEFFLKFEPWGFLFYVGYFNYNTSWKQHWIHV